MRLKQKLISFDSAEAIERAGISSLEEVFNRMADKQEVDAGELRHAGIAIATVLIDHKVKQGKILQILAPLLPFPKQLRIMFRKVEGGAFIYHGREERVESFELAETPFTIGQMKRLLELKGEKVRNIFQDPKWDVDKVIQGSEKETAESVLAEQKDNCPLVYVSQIEATGIAELLGYILPDERQCERAATGTDGLIRPWGKKLSKDKAVYGDSGTRPVKSKPAGVSKEGIYDLIGLVWEWTSSLNRSGTAELFGGSWCVRGEVDLQGISRSVAHLGYRNPTFGFRLARAIG